jgi:hypothetical protein
MMNRTMPLASLCCVLLASLPACENTETSVNPVPLPLSSPDAAVDAVADAPVVPPEAGPVVRKITLRDPFGQLDPANKLHDGDFELSGLNGMQYPWQVVEQQFVRTGAVCRSGLRCVQLYPGERVSGMFVWPDAPYAEVSFYGAITTEDCEKEGVALLMRFDDYYADPIRILNTTAKPVDGWCHYGATVEVDKSWHWYGLMVAARSKADGPTIFDQASIRGTDVAPAELRSLAPLPADVLQLAEKTREQLLKLRPAPPREPKPVSNPTGRRKLTR